MKFEQGSKEWHEWRAQGIGASEVPIVMGESDFMTPHQLWEIKTGRNTKTEDNWAMQRGSQSEQKIRSIYTLTYGYEIPPCLFEHSDLPFFRCSLDGYNEERRLIVEIKYPSLEKHLLAKSGQVPLTYRAQLQAQLFVSGAEKAHYVSFDGENIAVVDVFPDENYMKTMIERVSHFWTLVQNGTPPEFTDRDYKEIKSASAKALIAEYRKATQDLTLLETVRDEIKARVIDLCDQVNHPRVLIDQVKIQRIQKMGTIDYAKLMALPQVSALGIDLEEFRKPESKPYYRFDFPKTADKVK